MQKALEGGCQCGELRYAIHGEPLTILACHCSECQRQSGSAFGMSMIVSRDDFEIVAGEPRFFARSAASGGTVECGFCPSCGTRIFHRPSSLPETINVKPGTLDDREHLAPAFHVWISSKQPWVPIPEDATRFEKNPGGE